MFVNFNMFKYGVKKLGYIYVTLKRNVPNVDDFPYDIVIEHVV